MSAIKNIIKQIATEGSTASLFVGTVSAVDSKARTVDVEPINEDAPVLGVNLQANQESTFGVVAFPKVGSYVVVGFVADGAAGVVLLTDEVESVEVAISGDTARISADKDGVRVLMGDDTSAELTKEGITLNGGGFGGTVKVGQLTERINAIEQDINDLKSVFSGWVAVPQDGGAALSAAAAAWSATPLELTQRGDYENEKVKHG